MTDNALILAVTKAQQGDTRAFDCLVRQFQNPAVAYARTILRDPIAAEDAAQEAFVEAWRDLPHLTEAASFGGWLRRIVFKYCDRVRRSSRSYLPLSDMLELPHYLEPSFVVERADDASQVRNAVDTLPETLRETTLLYYLTGRNIKEIAAFLELPPSTVKNRLHAARKQLRKDLWIMAETILEKDKPSKNDAFAENVLSRVLKEYDRQRVADPENVDGGLLDQGQTALFEYLAQDEPFDVQTVRDGFKLLGHKTEPGFYDNSLRKSRLLMRYLAQPLSDSETAWAYVHLANSIGSAAGAVLAHEAFERWLPGKSPVLSLDWPYYPVPADDPKAGYVGDEVRILFLAQSGEFSTAYLALWRNNEYLAKVDAVLSEIPVTPRNRRQRFFLLRMATNACESSGDYNGSARYVQLMHELSHGAENASLKAELKCKALDHQLKLAWYKKDEAAIDQGIAELTALLNREDLRDAKCVPWVAGERHNFACQLGLLNRDDLALPLWEANAADGGQCGGWGWLGYAATVWKVKHDRERTLVILRKARAAEDHDMLKPFLRLSEFDDVRDDPEFLKAIGRRK